VTVDTPHYDDLNGSTDDDVSDGSLSMPDLVALSSDGDLDSDSDDDAHFLAADDVSDDDDAPDYCDLPRAIQFGLGLLIWFPKGIYDVVAVLGLNAQVVC
jgi:hypothetical protein